MNSLLDSGIRCRCVSEKRQQSITISPLIIQAEKSIARFHRLSHAVLGDDHRARVKRIDRCNLLERSSDQVLIVGRIKKNEIKFLTLPRNGIERSAHGHDPQLCAILKFETLQILANDARRSLRGID